MLVKHGYWSLFVISTLVSSLCYGDTIAPKPAKMGWRYVPAATGPYTITMTATTALDANDMPVQYNFVCTNDGTKSSGWQSSPVYEASSLTPKTTYTFNVQARDSAVPPNTNTASYNASATTDDNSTPPVLRLDLNNSANNDDANTQTGFLPFIIENSGTEINGVAIDLGGNITSTLRSDPVGTWTKYDSGGSIPGDPCYYSPRAGERIYRDFVYGISPSGVTITLWGMGVNRDCNITIWAYDQNATSNLAASWYSNGTHIFDANFIGGSMGWPRYDNQTSTSYQDLYKYIFKGRGTSDNLGRIVLTSTIGPNSPADQPFAFVNAIKVEPNKAVPFVPTNYAYHPIPVAGANGVSADVALSWRKGGYAETHDVYLGTSFNDVNTASRGNPLGVLVSQDHSTTTYTPAEFLDLNTTYSWRIDEVSAAPDYTIFKGEVWNFKTLPYFVLDNFNFYANDAALRSVWKDGSTNGASAEVSVETATIRDGNSMRYWYKNNLSPYYSEAYADIADLGIDDHNWLGIGAQALVLYFYGDPTNPIDEKIYVKLTDGDSPAKTATIFYGDTNDVRLKQWNKWSIPLTAFADANLTNVARITIGFGDGSPGNAGTVYFDDITLDIAGFEEPVTTGEVDVSTVYQQLEGFGAAVGFGEYMLPFYLSEPSRNSLYDVLFNDLGLDIYRVRNTYGYDSSYIDYSAQIIAAGKSRNPSLKILISAWSPQPSLKSNNSKNGGGNATLAKDPADPNNSAPYYYVYKKYAKWWADSVTDWSSHGVVADYVSIQNEPDFDASYDSCRFDPNENSLIAGYNQAFEAVYQQLYSQMGLSMPKMLAPEVLGLYNPGTYINNLVDRSHAYGFAHHLYAGGTYDSPDTFIPLMTDFRNNFGDRPRMQTEFSKLGDGDVTAFIEAMNLAQLMHNSLVFENVSAYLYWELFQWSPKGLVRFTWQNGSFTYVMNPVYYAFKQYAAFTDPGWRRVDASTDLGPQGNVRISAFKSPDGQQLSIVIINLAHNSINLSLNLNGFLPDSSDIYRTSGTENTTYVGTFYGEMGLLALPAYSITTIHMTGTTTPCAEVRGEGHGLTSDISGDCYVNYKDLKIIADHWLADCTALDNCGGADFAPTDGKVDFLDFARFAEQWLWCNDPADANCIQNW